MRDEDRMRERGGGGGRRCVGRPGDSRLIQEIRAFGPGHASSLAFESGRTPRERDSDRPVCVTLGRALLGLKLDSAAVRA